MLFKTPEPVITTRRLANSGTYLAVDLRPRPDWRIIRNVALATLCGLFLGAGATRFALSHVAAQADSAARTQYAELVNYCYEHTSTRELMYSCIAADDMADSRDEER